MKRVRAKKSFGQHFLNNEAIAMRIVDGLIDHSDIGNVLEVGPGQGVLTKHLLVKGRALKLVEADVDMVEYISAAYPQLVDHIYFKDFLKLKLDEAFQGDSFGLIGNYPYNISSQIIFHMIKYKPYIPVMVGMFQKEVADRIVAPHGSKTYGVISVLTQAHYDCEYLFTVNPESFNPPPRVMSAVIRLTRKEESIDCDESLFKSVVKISFGQRRKMLRNTMKQFIKDPEALKEDLFTKRPEQLSLEDFVSLTKQIETQNL